MLFIGYPSTVGVLTIIYIVCLVTTEVCVWGTVWPYNGFLTYKLIYMSSYLNNFTYYSTVTKFAII